MTRIGKPRCKTVMISMMMIIMLYNNIVITSLAVISVMLDNAARCKVYVHGNSHQPLRMHMNE